MLRLVMILVAMCCISYATADEETELLEKIYHMAQNVVNTTTELQQKNEIFEARKGFSPLHFLFPLCEYQMTNDEFDNMFVRIRVWFATVVIQMFRFSLRTFVFL